MLKTLMEAYAGLTATVAPRNLRQTMRVSVNVAEIAVC